MATGDFNLHWLDIYIEELSYCLTKVRLEETVKMLRIDIEVLREHNAELLSEVASMEE